MFYCLIILPTFFYFLTEFFVATAFELGFFSGIRVREVLLTLGIAIESPLSEFLDDSFFYGLRGIFLILSSTHAATLFIEIKAVGLL